MQTCTCTIRTDRSAAAIDVCVDMCIDMCMCMCMCMCIDVCIDTRKNMCIDMCVDMCLHDQDRPPGGRCAIRLLIDKARTDVINLYGP